MRLKLVCCDNFTQALKSFIYSAVMIILFVMVVSWYLLSLSLILRTGLCLLKGNKVPSPCVFCDHTTWGNVQRTYLFMRSQSHERSWPPVLKLKFGNGWLTSKCCGSSCKKFISGFQFQFQFQGFQFQFHFQFHQFQFQFQFRNWNWNWPTIPIPELNWPQPCLWLVFVHCSLLSDLKYKPHQIPKL